MDEDDVIYVARGGSTSMRNVGFVLGAPVPANVSSAGIALLCCSSEVNRWLAERKFVPFTPYTVTTQEGIRELIEAARRKGYALLEQQFERRCAASPCRSATATPRPWRDQRQPADGERDYCAGAVALAAAASRSRVFAARAALSSVTICALIGRACPNSAH